jgi:hypothetical protein
MIKQIARFIVEAVMELTREASAEIRPIEAREKKANEMYL